MKSLSVLAAVLFCSAHVRAAALPDSAAAQVVFRPGKRVQCPQADSTPLFRRINTESEHFLYTTDAADDGNAHVTESQTGFFEPDGVTGRVFTTAQSGTVPLYHLAHARTQDHFYTRDAQARDRALFRDAAYTDAGVAAWVFATRVCGAIPLWRVHNPVIGAHFYTADPAERDDKMRNDGYEGLVIAGFVLRA
ncbi:hypothetical protein B0H17DRAFT_985317 [Mycena rosella]|uniref:DUF5648 domain-containing protein n=1 Tax=Mycena rosella TaxID=1033263 RepID=A0AAD7D9A6_MYCRO|nr:hypothetical protein B0H17DRAFT_985317 [Mycena rosella]